ncbi:MAG TPA: hypothetical protein VKB80_26035 [Kofleriaceae bacterium]|nr:hypothetical protein [Kofleriaceae bacterium]
MSADRAVLAGLAVAAVAAAIVAAIVAVCPSPARAGEPVVPDRVQELIAAHCIRCHDSSHAIDLTTPPPPGRRSTWMRILAEVKSGRMPPADRRSIAGRFPLDPEPRADLVAGIESMLGASVDPEPPARFLAPQTWAALAIGLAAPVLGDAAAKEMVVPVVDQAPSRDGRLRGMSSALQIRIDRASQDLCRGIAGAERALAPDRRTLFPRGTAPAELSASVGALEARLFGGASSAAVRRGVDLHRRLLRRTRDPSRAWIALCTIYLSGPRLWFGPYDGR